MKTFTVTCQHVNNYGALLQAYALQQTILDMGHENTLMRFPHKSISYAKLSLSNPKGALRSVYLNWLLFCRRKKMRALDQRFCEFHANHLQESRVYRSMQEFRDDEPDADCLITGSDQVWSMGGRPDWHPAFFLDFGKPEAKRISYAASMERHNRTDEQKQRMVQWLSRFDGISLREESTRRYIEELTGRHAEWVVDPVFLLDVEKWKAIAKKPRIEKPYILCYQVMRNDRMQEIVNRLKKLTGYPVVSICSSQIKWIHSDITLFDVSPEEFLGLFQNAALVVTASFHGTAFGLTFGKPTYGLVRSSHANRIRGVLERFGLGQFCIDENSEIPSPELDAVVLADRIAREREASLQFLKTYLENE